MGPKKLRGANLPGHPGRDVTNCDLITYPSTATTVCAVGGVAQGARGASCLSLSPSLSLPPPNPTPN